LTSIGVVGPRGTAVAPQAATLKGSRGQSREVDLTRGSATFEPMRTRRLVVRFEAPAATGSRPVGVAELELPQLESQVHRTDHNRRTGAICGLGPELEVDGRIYPTKVKGSIAAVLDGTPLIYTGCGRSVKLSPGTHRVVLRATDQFTATRLVLRPASASGGGVPAGGRVTRRDVQVRSWDADRRVVSVAPGDAALLVVPENANAGWRATLGDDRLTPVRVDGWMQGYLVPEGAGGTVVLEFTPNRPYQAGLGLGGVLALVLVGGAVFLRRRDAPVARLLPDPERSDHVEPWPWPWRLATLLAGAVVGGPAAGAGLLLGDLGRRRIGDPGAVGAVLVGLAGAGAGIVASQQGGLPPVWCDALAGAGVGLVAAVLLTRSPATRGGHEHA
jgi:arabinofuranan 3-O-arabinosyltransferase